MWGKLDIKNARHDYQPSTNKVDVREWYVGELFVCI